MPGAGPKVGAPKAAGMVVGGIRAGKVGPRPCQVAGGTWAGKAGLGAGLGQARELAWDPNITPEAGVGRVNKMAPGSGICSAMGGS
jgi:hypothetical protein